MAAQQALSVILVLPVCQQQIALNHLHQLVVAARMIPCKLEPGHLWPIEAISYAERLLYKNACGLQCTHMQLDRSSIHK